VIPDSLAVRRDVAHVHPELDLADAQTVMRNSLVRAGHSVLEATWTDALSDPDWSGQVRRRVTVKYIEGGQAHGLAKRVDGEVDGS
jgi:hypothetical protein